MKTSFKKAALSFLATVFAISVVAAPLSERNDLNPVAVTAAITGGLFAIYLIAPSIKLPGVNLQGVEVEIWANYIIERLWKDNKFFQFMFSDDDKVLAGKIVHIPQPGTKPTVIKNRLNYPATAIRRVDTDITYNLDEYTTEPTHISDAEKVELSYNKIDSVYGDHAGQLTQDVAGNALVMYLTDLPQAQFIVTSGGNTSDNRTGMTGTRKKFLAADLRKASRKMDQENIPTENRVALLCAQHYDELLEDLSQTQYRDFSAQVDPAKGIVGNLFGFVIMKRSDIALGYLDSSNYKIRAYGSAVQTGDLEVSMCWQQNALARALGEVKFFENPDRAEYYGDVYSALLRFGGRRRRADDLGVIAIVQGT